MHARFYAPDAEEPGQTILLPGDEAEHLTRVLRLGIGAPIRVFNGRGGEFSARVARAGRLEVGVVLEASADAAIEPRVRITLVQAVLKPDAMDSAIRDAVMVGVAAIHPVVTTRSEATIAALARARRQERWMRIAVASAKQCGRAIVPPVYAPASLEQLMGGIGDHVAGPALMFVEPGASPAAVALHDLPAGGPSQLSLLVGPEGGWTREEIASVPAAVQLVTLRLPTLRASVTGTVACAALLGKWGEI